LPTPLEAGHGRLDQRCFRTLTVTPEQLGFPHAAQLLEIQRESTDKKTGATTTGRRLFVLSEPLASADAFAAARARWGIENKNHHPRDATWLEDKTRARTGHTAANLALLRGFVLVWWRRNHPDLCAPAFLLRNQRRLPAVLRELFQPLTLLE
jgi:predicted transposase YbfD/YdcC